MSDSTNLDRILAILTGTKVKEGNLWRVYDSLGVEIADASGVLLQGLHGFLLNNQYSLEIGGGIGHKKKKRWIERDGKILIFETNEQVESFIKSENIETVNETESIAESVVELPKPIEIIDKQEIKRLSTVYQYRQKLYHASQINDIDRIIQIYRELLEREEDDIEFLLMVL